MIISTFDNFFVFDQHKYNIVELLQVGGTMGLWLGLGVVQVMFWNGWFWLCVFCVLLVLFVHCCWYIELTFFVQ